MRLIIELAGELRDRVTDLNLAADNYETSYAYLDENGTIHFMFKEIEFTVSFELKELMKALEKLESVKDYV